MLDLDEIRAEIATFKKRYGLQDEDEHVIAAIHLINAHKIHPSLAQDQTSHGGGDNGIDGWYYDDKVGSLHVYQSKLTGSKGCAGSRIQRPAAGWQLDRRHSGIWRNRHRPGQPSVVQSRRMPGPK